MPDPAACGFRRPHGGTSAARGGLNRTRAAAAPIDGDVNVDAAAVLAGCSGDEETGDFSSEGWDNFKWRAKIIAPQTDGVSPEQLIGARTSIAERAEALLLVATGGVPF
mgnify:CR=1 FL=1